MEIVQETKIILMRYFNKKLFYINIHQKKRCRELIELSCIYEKGFHNVNALNLPRKSKTLRIKELSRIQGFHMRLFIIFVYRFDTSRIRLII